MASRERRQAMRYAVRVPVRFDGHTGMTLNVSASGAAFETDAPLRIGQPLRLRMRFASSEVHVRSTAHVVRVEKRPGGTGAAVRFEETESAVLEAADGVPPQPGRRDPGWPGGRTSIVREHRLTIAAGMVALGAAAPVVYDSVVRALGQARAGAYLGALGDLTLVLLTGLLGYGTIVYLLTRIGHLARLRAAPDEQAEDGPFLEEPGDSPLVALVPSSQEEPHVVLRALVSAALQPHANRRVVLLIDDPPDGDQPAPSLEAARALPGHVQTMLAPMRERCAQALGDFERRAASATLDPAAEARRVADLCHDAARWFDAQADKHPRSDLADPFFVELTFREPAARWRLEAQRWAARADAQAAPLSPGLVGRAYRRALAVFQVELSSFERKRFANLSHASNKAMNVNTYLGLLGGAYRVEAGAAGPLLSPCAAGEADLVVPDANFALILDADTIVSPEYTPALLRRFRAPDGRRLAVVQCPYSTFPATSGVLQRIAGAQTDIQYLIHQGLTRYDATYWVGANALVRLEALREIAVTDVERGYPVVKFIRDRTLIEDTESTIDLIRKGWRLFNQAERLAFSMTPADFGSLLIQRWRWANGGLLIVPKLLAYLRQPGPRVARLTEGFMRLQYLISLGPVSMALLVALGVAWDKEVRTVGLLAVGLVYYAVYARDLHLIGYRWQDIFRVVSLNLVLIPVNIMGMLSSIAQAFTGRKPRFTRTPKVPARTPVPAAYLLAELALLGLWSAHFVFSLGWGRPSVGLLMLAHALFMAYAIGAFIGYRNSVADIAAALAQRHSRA
ncbi:MAG TPA: glycosyltransferase family 2 protein [Methylomirabilota bacterium]|nr:glycosyltransferase family 2 protein [Methylomirabilota bacterium]